MSQKGSSNPFLNHTSGSLSRISETASSSPRPARPRPPRVTINESKSMEDDNVVRQTSAPSKAEAREANLARSRSKSDVSRSPKISIGDTPLKTAPSRSSNDLSKKTEDVRPMSMVFPAATTTEPTQPRESVRRASVATAVHHTSSSPMLARRSCFLSPSIMQGHYRIGRGEQRMLDFLNANGRGFETRSSQGSSAENSGTTSPFNEKVEGVSSPPSPSRHGRSSASLRTAMIQTMMGVRHSSNELRRAELVWKEPPTNVLVINKPNDSEVHKCAVDVVRFILETRPQITIRVEAQNMDALLEEFLEEKNRIKLWAPVENPWEAAADPLLMIPDIDLVITLGGDGTLLHTANLFQLMAPPILSFALGSLGFLTPFDFEHYKESLNNCFDGRAVITLRTRLECEIIRAPGSTVVPDPDSKPVWNVMNEVVIDRGPAAYIAQLDVYCDGHPITRVQGDGLIIATPTGSTAYSVSAGGSMVHPTVPCMLVTPICPHSLSFRPIIMPATVELKVVTNPTGRTGAWVSMDGQNRQELGVGDGIRITTSVWPIPTVARRDISKDWFGSLAKNLNWNIREMQKVNSQTAS